jgi:hypothetical protein
MSELLQYKQIYEKLRAKIVAGGMQVFVMKNRDCL